MNKTSPITDLWRIPLVTLKLLDDCPPTTTFCLLSERKSLTHDRTGYVIPYSSTMNGRRWGTLLKAFWKSQTKSMHQHPHPPLPRISVHLSSTLREIDPDTAYVVCISVSLGFPYMVSVFPFFPYMVSICPCFLILMQPIVLRVALLWAAIVPRTAIVTSQWYDHYCFAEYVQTWVRHPTMPWQCACTAITDFQSIDSL